MASRIDGGSGNSAIASLLELVSSSQILFGTDFPPGGTNLALAKAVAELGLFKENDLRAIERENAVRLLPRLKSSALQVAVCNSQRKVWCPQRDS